MKKRTKIKILIVIGLSALALAVLYHMLLVLLGAGAFRALTLKSDLDTLLHKTDHQALLAACRVVMKEGYRGDYKITWPDTHPDAEKLPKEILRLGPTYISVFDEGRVKIEMWGGMSHFGVVAYAEDFKEPYKDFKGGNKKLIDGLWFYSDFIDLNEGDN
ncbi:MAG: hypothetical protein ACYTBX_15975 [Planctomycetota bacterium]|jgi:hypothetical protein